MYLKIKEWRRWNEVRAPPGKYVVCVWDPARPRNDIGVVSGPFEDAGTALDFEKRLNEGEFRRNQKAAKEREYSPKDVALMQLGVGLPGEEEYITIDSSGARVLFPD